MCKSLIAQTKDYTSMRYMSEKENELISELQEKLTKDLTEIPSDKKEKIGKIYLERTAGIIHKVKNKHLIFASPLNDRLEKILTHILSTNPTIPSEDIRIFLSRYPWPNASCLGEGSMIFNIGLIRRLENDDQIAFILCHELAHFTENHVNNTIYENINAYEDLINSKAFKDIQGQEYGSYEAAQNLLKGFTFENKRHSRSHEKEADAIGMSYYIKTKYSIPQAIRSLEILDEIDREKYAGKIDIKKIFDNKTYPFQNKWLRSKSSGLSAMSSTTSEWNIDCLLYTSPSPRDLSTSRMPSSA